MAAMRRQGSAAVLCFSFFAFALAGGCNDITPVPHPTGAECTGGTPDEDAAACEGKVCLVLNPNYQDIAGICSEECNVDDDCTPHERCVVIINEPYCLRACLTDDDCYDATVCRAFAPGNPTRFCLADPL